MKVEIWSDVVCPWCSIGKRRFDSALERFEHRDEVEVVWRSYELDPEAPIEREGDYVDHVATRYGKSVDEAQATVDQLTGLADEVGLEFRFDRARPGNSFDAHRLIHLADRHGLQHEAKERLFAAYLTDGEVVGDRTMLVRVGVGLGLDRDEVVKMLESDDFVDEVRGDERQAAVFGIGGVPFFVFDRKYAVSGAQPADVMLQVLGKAWAASQPLLVVDGATEPGSSASGQCSDEGCAV